MKISVKERKKLAAAQGLSYEAVHSYAQRHEKSFIGALKDYKNGEYRRRNRQVILNSMIFPTIHAACEAAGVSRSAIGVKMKAGMSFQEAVNDIKNYIATPKKVHSAQEVTYKGKTYKSVCYACSVLDRKATPIRNRMRAGMTFEEAIVDIDGKQNPAPIYQWKDKARDFFLYKFKLQ